MSFARKFTVVSISLLLIVMCSIAGFSIYQTVKTDWESITCCTNLFDIEKAYASELNSNTSENLNSVISTILQKQEEHELKLAEEAVRAQEIAQQEAQQSYQYTTYTEPTYTQSSSSYDSDFKSAGVVHDNGYRYTWYSQNVLPGGGLTELNNNGRHVNSEGFVCDGDGYIAVASSDHAKGTIISTPFGEAKVYDSGCASGTIDVYTNY